MGSPLTKWFVEGRRNRFGEVLFMAEESQTEQTAPVSGIGTMVFAKWDATEVTCADPGIRTITISSTIDPPQTAGRK